MCIGGRINVAYCISIKMRLHITITYHTFPNQKVHYCISLGRKNTAAARRRAHSRSAAVVFWTRRCGGTGWKVGHGSGVVGCAVCVIFYMVYGRQPANWRHFADKIRHNFQKWDFIRKAYWLFAEIVLTERKARKRSFFYCSRKETYLLTTPPFSRESHRRSSAQSVW